MVLAKTCPECRAEHTKSTTLCHRCYRARWLARKEPRQCSECGKMKLVFSTESLCAICYQRVRNTRMVGTCVDCGQHRRIPSNGRCCYCDQKRRRATAPKVECRQCSRLSPKYVEGLCRSCYTNNTKRFAKYGIRPAEYMEMLRVQRGKCAICNDPFGKAPHIDHCHETGVIRALLCYTCNVGLGSFRDEPLLLRMAAAYLESHRARRVA